MKRYPLQKVTANARRRMKSAKCRVVAFLKNGDYAAACHAAIEAMHWDVVGAVLARHDETSWSFDPSDPLTPAKVAAWRALARDATADSTTKAIAARVTKIVEAL